MEHKRDKVRYGIIGCGVIAPLHAEGILACPYAELVAVADLDEIKAKAIAEKYLVKKVYTDYKDLLKDQKVDVVSICTPSGLHAEITIAAAQANKHVLCEKPLEITAEKMTKMITACREANVKLGVVYQRRALAVSRAVKQAIEEGKLGKLVLCDAYLKYYRDQKYYDSAGWRGTWAIDGGGALMNQGVHGVDLIQWLAGGVEKVFGRTAALARKIEVEDTAVAVVQYKNGAFGVIEGATTVYPERSTRMEIHGEKGTIIFDDQGLQEWKVLDEMGGGEVTITEEKIEGVRSIGHYRFIEDMSQAILEDREPLVPGEEARKAVDIILAIYESSRTGKEVELHY